jgi:hypothetical protein
MLQVDVTLTILKVTASAMPVALPIRYPRRERRGTMTDVTHLAEQHIRAHEARLGHIDELVQRVRKAAGDLPEFAQVHTELEDLVRERDRQAVRIDDMRAKAAEQWREEEIGRSGLMGVWDALAQQLEGLVEKVERHR